MLQWNRQDLTFFIRQHRSEVREVLLHCIALNRLITCCLPSTISHGLSMPSEFSRRRQETGCDLGKHRLRDQVQNGNLILIMFNFHTHRKLSANNKNKLKWKINTFFAFGFRFSILIRKKFNIWTQNPQNLLNYKMRWAKNERRKVENKWTTEKVLAERKTKLARTTTNGLVRLFWINNKLIAII